MRAIATGRLLGLALLAGTLAQSADVIAPEIDDQDRDRIEAAIRSAFPGVTAWRLSAAFVGHVDTGIDRRVHVDVPADGAVERIARHVRFGCERRRADRTWRCGQRWQMLWQVDRIVASSGMCEETLLGLGASTVSDQQVILDVVDHLSLAARAPVSVPGCGRLEAETMCRVSSIDSIPDRLGATGTDLEIRLRNGLASNIVVGTNRHCDGPGPCLLEFVRCVFVEAD